MAWWCPYTLCSEAVVDELHAIFQLADWRPALQKKNRHASVTKVAIVFSLE
jgi:hypothetical protein